jgi:hypothetical protein
MTWTAYHVTLRLLAPMHIGWRKLGNLQQTRPYVTGRNLWGALTARLTRELGSNKYEFVGKQVDDCMRFTYFYPSVSKDNVEPWPWRKNDAEADKHSHCSPNYMDALGTSRRLFVCAQNRGWSLAMKWRNCLTCKRCVRRLGHVASSVRRHRLSLSFYS